MTFLTEESLREWLHESIDESHFLRDADDRPWIVTWGADDLFVISYPTGDKRGAMPAPATYHGGLDLPTYPVRIVKES